MNKQPLINKIRHRCESQSLVDNLIIPKKIFQTYATTELNPGALDAIESWRA